MKIEDYNKYYIQGSDHYLIPKDVFIELFNEMSNWREESKELNQKYLNAVADYETTMSELQELKKENKILRENAENNDKVVDKFNWGNMLLKKENKELKIQISAREEVYNRLESNWNKLKEYLNYKSERAVGEDEYVYDELIDKMQELEQESDSNE